MLFRIHVDFPNKQSGDGRKEYLDRVCLLRWGDPGVFVVNRASLPQKGQLTACAKFHRDPVALPPPVKHEKKEYSVVNQTIYKLYSTSIFSTIT